MPSLTYKDAGVDVEAGEALVQRIKRMSAGTRTPHVLSGIGGFAGLCGLPSGLHEPVLVSGTDGVGTKLKIAFAMDRHDTVGIDLVAMCVNDILTVGAQPLFFLDYFATGKLDVDQAERVVRGISEGCRESGCALLGGETAELPGFYSEGEYDLAGFAVGVAERAEILDGKKVSEGDVLLGMVSNGLHSNGYSLARKALFEHGGLALNDTPVGLGETLGESLLRPTRIYARQVRAALDVGGIHSLCHITGGGLPGNLPRVLPDGLCASVSLHEVPRPAIFDIIQESGSITEDEMRHAFNLGVGMVLVVDATRKDQVVDALGSLGESPVEMGTVTTSDGETKIRFT